MENMKIGDKVKVTVDLPTPDDALYGYLRIAKAGDVGVVVRVPTEDNPKCAIKFATCAMNLDPEILEPMVDTPPETNDESPDYQTCPIVIEMYGLTGAPVFKETEMGTLFDFNSIIPIGEDDDAAKCWGTPFNSNDTIILSESCVTFHTAGGIPYPIFEALSKMYPNRVLYAAYYKPGTSDMVTRMYGNGSILREMNNVPLTHWYQPGTPADRIIETLDSLGDLDRIRQYKVFAEGGLGIKLAIDHENQSIYIIPTDTRAMVEVFARRARDASWEMLKARLDPVVACVPTPMDDIPQVDVYSHPDAKCTPDDEDDE